MRKVSRYVSAGVAVATMMAALGSSAAQAHGIWFAQRAKQLALIYGVGSDDLDAVKRLPLINAVTGLDAAGKPVPTKLRAAGIVPVVESERPAVLVAAVMDYGMWSKDKAGTWHNKGRDEVLGAVVSEHNFKYAVHLASLPKQAVPMIAGHRLQIVPVGTAIPQEMGQPLRIRAYFEGKPASGVSILADWVNDPDHVQTKTDADGYATVPVRNQGLNVLMGVLVTPSDNPAKYERMEHSASLSFVLPHEEE
ncbi:DUF4198 domain-containing protein [Novosphingobium sp. ERN07]|uniref:DUF4198 domain-containing protein n=1 Tax=Novosphingobium sp. ERN07 TaxID=2726187 RepID=UPI00145729E0|nr:DUF4198 domain-containing protein [Novosphingobium sp. ERN07]NLR72313.1 DUF4198 domain-containing protein [Novosphingobium sp. ERN07]